MKRALIAAAIAFAPASMALNALLSILQGVHP